jgi:FliI/YscN family ATPase
MSRSIADRIRAARERMAEESPVDVEGYITASAGPILRAELPGARVGDLCRIEIQGRERIPAEVIGFDERGLMLMPIRPVQGVALHARVRRAGTTITVPSGDSVRGRVINAVGDPLDGGPTPDMASHVPMMGPPPNPMLRQPVDSIMPLGIPLIDGLLTIGRGQRVGIAAPAGVGKSTLLASIAEMAPADVVVLALIGERGCEVRPFVDKVQERGGERATVVVSTSDQPALMRLKAAFTATAIAEAAANQGANVVLMMDSVTRFARALREIGLAAGEPPGRQGFPASVFESMPKLFERAGNGERGSITAFYTILVTGDDLTEPVTDEAISLLDGHIVLSRELASRGQYPAIDVLHSVSRRMNDLVDGRHQEIAKKFRAIMGLYEKNYDRISLGKYQPPTEEDRDLHSRLERAIKFLRDRHPRRPLDETRSILETICFG